MQRRTPRKPPFSAGKTSSGSGGSRCHRLNARFLILGFACALGIGAFAFAWYQGISRYGIVPGIEGCRFVVDPIRRTDCVAERTADAVRGSGAPKALQNLKQISRRHEKIAAVCHAAGHDAAPMVVTAKRFEQFASEGFAVTGPCGDGFAHGAFIHVLRTGGPSTLARAAAYCRGRAGPGDVRPVANCMHSLGHGLRARAKMNDSLVTCREVSKGQLERRSCFEGAFMQDGMEQIPRIVRTRDFVSPCDEVPHGEESRACFKYTPSRTDYVSATTVETARVCAQAKHRDDQTLCLYSIGAGQLPRHYEMCDALRADFEFAWCLQGMFNSHVVSLNLTSWKQAIEDCDDMGHERRLLCARAIGMSFATAAGDDIPSPAGGCRAAFADKVMRARCLVGFDRGTRLEQSIERGGFGNPEL